jgi:hypothetical protein
MSDLQLNLSQGEEHALMGKLTLHSVYDQFRSDMFLSSLAESSAYILHTNTQELKICVQQSHFRWA